MFESQRAGIDRLCSCLLKVKNLNPCLWFWRTVIICRINRIGQSEHDWGEIQNHEGFLTWALVGDNHLWSSPRNILEYFSCCMWNPSSHCGLNWSDCAVSKILITYRMWPVNKWGVLIFNRGFEPKKPKNYCPIIILCSALCLASDHQSVSIVFI